MEEEKDLYTFDDVKEGTGTQPIEESKKPIEIKHAESLIKELFPEFQPAKHWITYSIYLDLEHSMFTVNRKPNFAYKLKTVLILPFIIIPYSFWFGYKNVRVEIKVSFKGNFVVGRYCDKEKYDKILEYAREHDLLK